MTLRRWYPLLSAGLLLLFFGVNLGSISRFPPFIDETVHIYTGELIVRNLSPLEGINLGRQFTVWWLALFQPTASDPLWVARAATLIAALVGVAAVMGIGRLAAGTWGMVCAALLYTFSAYHFFFGRLALADPVSGAAVLAALYFAYRLSRRVSAWDALLCGICLFCAVGAKINTLPYYGIPLAAVLTLGERRITLRRRAMWLGIALGVGLGLLAAFVLVVRSRGLDFLSNSLSLAVSARADFDSSTFFSLDRILGNAGLTVEALSGYLSPPVLGLCLLAVIILIVRRRWFLPLSLLAPVFALWINLPQETRFFIVPVAIMLLCAALVLAEIARRSRFAAVVTLIGVGVWAALVWLPFAVAAPADLPLPRVDITQYTGTDASGFGLDAVGAELNAREIQLVIGALSNCQGLRYRFPDLPVNCPLIRPNGQDVDALAQLFSGNRAAGVYVVLEASPYVPTSAPGQIVTTIDDAHGRPRLTLYDLTP